MYTNKLLRTKSDQKNLNKKKQSLELCSAFNTARVRVHSNIRTLKVRKKVSILNNHKFTPKTPKMKK